ncbi:MAG TPA: hypothetical protein VHE34_27780 [Puia sp.]|uniref:hypothetical protein n=1 Tax=Puia sp. TaxID=2045100 RepID=UPI002C83EE08|nr:hypothetical protein [Puia sp.]HVU99066.1 hypothetical protein [Puia sp.]
MFRRKHRSSRAALRCAFALIGLIFLTVQLSGRFYACSSQVVFAPAHKAIKSAIHSTDPRILSLDKRYKAQRSIALLIQPVRNAFAGTPVIPTPLLSKPLAIAGRRQAPVVLRGPPPAG